MRSGENIFNWSRHWTPCLEFKVETTFEVAPALTTGAGQGDPKGSKGPTWLKKTFNFYDWKKIPPSDSCCTHMKDAIPRAFVVAFIVLK